MVSLPFPASSGQLYTSAYGSSLYLQNTPLQYLLPSSPLLLDSGDCRHSLIHTTYMDHSPSIDPEFNHTYKVSVPYIPEVTDLKIECGQTGEDHHTAYHKVQKIYINRWLLI